MYIQGNYQTSMCWLTQAYNKDQFVTLHCTNWTSKLKIGNIIQIYITSFKLHTIALAENKNKCGGKWITLIRNWYHYDTHKLRVTRVINKKGKKFETFHCNCMFFWHKDVGVKFSYFRICTGAIPNEPDLWRCDYAIYA